jgi:catechol 2,3-dioxygenase-like lactoylglutathione lyase family enzyme
MADPLEALRLPVVGIEPRPDFAGELLRRLEDRGGPGSPTPARPGNATVRYFVDDLAAAVTFYCEHLGFEEELRSEPAFAMLYRGDLRLLLSVPGPAHVLPDGTLPRPGGWNRMSLMVADLAGTVAALRSRGDTLRDQIRTSVGVRQALLEDPSGNLVELYEPIPGYHERKS